ncbi:hypothetical protein MTO96_051100 [Rhipicephalus appendiculatus]
MQLRQEGKGETDMCCGGEDEVPAAVGSKRKSPSGAQPLEDAKNHAQEPKRPRSGTRKIDAIEEMVNQLTNKTERMFETLLTRLNESDVERNAQYAAVNAQLAAVNKRIEDLERGTVQLQQQQRHEPGGAGLQLPHVVSAPTILNRSRNANATHTEAGGTHGQSRPPPTPLNNHHGCVPQVRRQTHSLAMEL